MTVTLELKPGAEAAARAEAQSRGVVVENYLQTLLEQTLPAPPEDLESLRRRRVEVLSRLQGKYAGLAGGGEEFAAWKAEEKVREERHWPIHN